MFIFVAVAVMVLANLVSPQLVAATELAHTYGDSGDETAFAVIECSDRGLVMAGTTTSSSGAGGADMLVVKTDSVGVEQWAKTYGDTGDDHALSAIEHSIDDGLVLAGRTTSWGVTSVDMMLVKTDSDGVEQWTKTYGHATGDEIADSVIEHSIDNGLVLAGWTTSAGLGAGGDECLLVKTDSAGVEQWTKTYGGSNDERALSVIEHSVDTGLVLCGRTNSFGGGSHDVLLVKTTFAGVVQWTKSYGHTGAEIGKCVIEHSIDNGLVITGRASEWGAGNKDVLLIKTDSGGVEQWTKTFGSTGADQALSVREHSIDNGLVICASTSSSALQAISASGTDILIVKTNSVGVQQWAKSYGGSGDDMPKSLLELSSGNEFVIAGFSDTYGDGSSDFSLIVQPADGSGTMGVDKTATEGSHTVTEIDESSITETTQTLTDASPTLTGVDQAIATTVVHANPTPSRSSSVSISSTTSVSSSPSRTPSQGSSASSTKSASVSQSGTSAASASATKTASQTASSTQTATQTSSRTPSQTLSQTASSSQTPSLTPSQTASLTASQSASSTKSGTYPCGSNPCQNGGACSEVDGTYPRGFLCDCTSTGTCSLV